MDDTSKYLIHAAITADGVVERSDVVGAIFGQTEGLLGDDLDLRDLQQSSKVGRIDVEIDSEGGQSFGHITIASSLDRVETAILAASLETITRVGPCRSEVRVTDIEDIREAKRREVVERAKELLADAFDESIMSSKEILEEVRESVRVENITEYEGLPAGPRVEDSDAIIVVEGRADVLTLLRYGVKNAIAVEGTNVPDAVADLSQERTVTAFFDGDRGGELILRELAQVGAVDYVAFAPEGQSVEDLTRHEVMSALRDKLPYDTLSSTDLPEGPPEDSGTRAPREGSWATTESSTAPSVGGAGDESDDRAPPADAEADGSGTAVGVRSRADPHEATTESIDGANVENGSADAGTPATGEAATDAEVGGDGTDTEAAAEASDAEHADGDGASAAAASEADAAAGQEAEADAANDEAAEADDADSEERDTVGRGLETLRGHVRAVVGESSGQVRLLDDDLATLADDDAQVAFELLRDAETTPYAVVIDGELTQRILDVAAQRGVEHVVARSTGEFVKRPVDVRVRTADQLLESHAAPE